MHKGYVSEQETKINTEKTKGSKLGPGRQFPKGTRALSSHPWKKTLLGFSLSWLGHKEGGNHLPDFLPILLRKETEAEKRLGLPFQEPGGQGSRAEAAVDHHGTNPPPRPCSVSATCLGLQCPSKVESRGASAHINTCSRESQGDRWYIKKKKIKILHGKEENKQKN